MGNRSAIWGGATLGLVVGLILGFFVGSYWTTVLYAVLRALRPGLPRTCSRCPQTSSTDGK
jgi:hypothetical protein